LVKTLLKWYWTVRELMLTGGRQLAAGPLGPRLDPHGVQHLVSIAQLLTRLGGAALAAQPFAVEQVGAGQLRPELGAAEPVDRFAVERPDGLTLAQQRL
jgi:hypothetical protein